MTTPSIFSRILMIVGALAVVGFTYWFITTSLAPLPVPEAPPARGNVRFDPRVDVSKNPSFQQLYPLGPMTIVPPTTIGRQDPFSALPVFTAPSGTMPVVSSTPPVEPPADATSTPPAPPTP